MRDIDLYVQILGLSEPWEVTAVELDRVAGQVLVKVSLLADARVACPSCGRSSPGYDHRVRRWRHLDTCQYTTILEAQVPRVSCPEHGVLTIPVPGAEPDSGFTQLFEALVIDWLEEASMQAVARQLRMSWGAIDRIMQRAVARGLARRAAASQLWSYRSRSWAKKAWERWLCWALRCRLPPMRKVALTIRKHLWGILNAIVLKQNNGHAEGMNSKIQRVKQRACGFRNRERFRNAIYFHFGGLDLYPSPIKAA